LEASTSVTLITFIEIANTSSWSARARISSTASGRLFGAKIRSIRKLLSSYTLYSQPSGGRSQWKPSFSSTSSARTASASRSRKSTS
jgi:hypothetical protein